MRPLFPAVAAITLSMSLFSAALADTNYVPFEGEKTSWHDGFDRFDYVMDEATGEITPFKRDPKEGFAVGNPAKGQRRCIVVAPKQPAPGNPWSWQGCYWDHEPQTEVELLRRGFHIAFITPDPGRQWDVWYQHLTEKHGLSKQPAFVGMSKGGVNEYDWTTENPDKVSCIYADNPAIRPEAFAKLGELAKNDVALLNVCGSQDFLLQKHTLPIEARYLQLGGRITVVVKDGPAHHPHSLRNPKLIADWIAEHMHPEPGTNRPAFIDGRFAKSYYYSLESTNLYLKEEKTFANCRGPGFVESFTRYDTTTGSQWGVAGMAIIVPNHHAPGLPWVFRADNIFRDTAIDQELLARGFHIVIAPLTEQSGPAQKQWDDTYKLMIENGFAKKPVLEGTGTSAGEAYTWAIANPDKTSCIVGRNPALRSLMTKQPPMDNLAPLATAHVPILHVSDSRDPWLGEYTQAAQKRYGELGGEFKLIRDNGENHGALPAALVNEAADFIAAKAK